MQQELMIDGVRYHRVDDSGERMRIAIVDNRGLTFVGRMSLNGNSEWITIHDARCVIYWGTTKHLAQLAADGPTDKTRLGQTRDVIVSARSIVAVYDCGEGWS